MSAPRRPAGHMLHRELRSWPTFALEEVARLVRAEVELALDETGLSWHDVIVLTVLSEVRAMSQPAVRDRTGLDRTTVGSILADFEEEGLVERRRDVGDRRQMTVMVTALGREVVGIARARVTAAERDAFRPLRPAQQRRFHELLMRLLPAEQHPLAELLR